MVNTCFIINIYLYTFYDSFTIFLANSIFVVVVVVNSPKGWLTVIIHSSVSLIIRLMSSGGHALVLFPYYTAK